MLQDSRLPVDERAVAVEGEGLEIGELHGGRQSLEAIQPAAFVRDHISPAGGGTTKRSDPPSAWVEGNAAALFDNRARRYSTVTLFARLRGWSTSVPFKTATW